MLSAEEALQLFEAAPEEKPFATTEDFDRLYQRVKLSLFRSDTKNRNDKNILKAIQKINAIKVKLPEDYYSGIDFLNRGSIVGLRSAFHQSGETV